jgi:hypothetical protein
MSAAGASEPTLPVLACKTRNAQTDFSGTDWRLPHNLRKTAAAPPRLTLSERSRLAWYEGILRVNGNFRLVGPSGWTCTALLANDGNWTMKLVPRGKKTVEQIRTEGIWGYQALGVACAYFPAARRAYDQPSLCKPPTGAKVTLESRHLATVTTPAGRSTRIAGSGYVLWYMRRPLNLTDATRCDLARADRTLCAAILGDTRARQQRSLEALIRR